MWPARRSAEHLVRRPGNRETISSEVRDKLTSDQTRNQQGEQDFPKSSLLHLWPSRARVPVAQVMPRSLPQHSLSTHPAGQQKAPEDGSGAGC